MKAYLATVHILVGVPDEQNENAHAWACDAVAEAMRNLEMDKDSSIIDWGYTRYGYGDEELSMVPLKDLDLQTYGEGEFYGHIKPAMDEN